MKKSIFLAIIIIWSFSGFAQNTPKTLKIATFNIQNFGKSKIAKPEIVDTLVAIVRLFDIVAVQEISDISNEVAYEFLDKINANNQFQYKLACSKRTGQQANDKSSQEQYAFYYNANKVTLTDTALFDDSPNDLFQREPYIAAFKTVTGNFSFVLCTIHTNPELTVQEIEALFVVAAWIPLKFKEESNVIFCGDFNASCTYAKPAELANLQIHKKPYNWIIPDNVKTNLSLKSDCAYDRFVVTDSLLPKVTKWAVLPYFKTKAVSDHWPVYIELKY